MINFYSVSLFIIGVLAIIYGLYIIIAKRPLITKIKQPIFRYHKNFIGWTIIFAGLVFIMGGLIATVFYDNSLIIVGGLLLFVLGNRYEESRKLNSISFDNFKEYFGDNVSENKELSEKLNKICSLIQGGERDIKKIAEESSCKVEECVFNIKYLKNTKKIPDYNIDTYHLRLLNLTPEDEKLLKKYKPILYGSHPQIDVIARSLASQDGKTIEEEKELVFNELKYLDDRKLLNGIVFNEVDKKLVYYDVKNANSSNLVTVHCPNCGALNDINIGSKERCIYCNTIIVGDDNDD